MIPLRIDQLRLDGGTQTRATLDELTISDYAEAMKAGAQFPPVIVFNDGSTYWLADGFHRVSAARMADFPIIQGEVRQGTRRDAILFSVGANTAHGLRRTNDDKRRAVLALLEDEEWSKWSDRRISDACGVSPTTVGTLRASVQFGQMEGPRTVERNGSTYTMNTAAIGRQHGPPIGDPLPWRNGGDEDAAAAHLLRTSGPNRERPERAEPPTPDYVPAIDEPVASWKERNAQRMQEREERHRELAAKNRALDMGERRFSVIYPDCPWRYNNDGVNGAAEDHYPTMSTDELCALPVQHLTTEDAVLLLWVPNALLEDGLRVVQAWGFDYKTSFVWVKEGGRVGTGWYNQQDHELLLVAVKGGGMTAAKRFSSVIRAPKAEHSRKPEVVYQMIAEMYPGAPCLEMFRRGAPYSDAWTIWGNQAEGETGAPAA